jgi:Mannose-1-phosphate guanylyltransferase
VQHTIVACILAGGAGTRLYPASRSFRPKQLLSFDGGPSLLERTVERAAFADETLVIASAEAESESMISSLGPETEVVHEPEAKDTGPALVYAAWQARARYENPVLVVMPVDHQINNDNHFRQTAETAVTTAIEDDTLVTLGVEPDRPATSYGYVLPETADEAAPVERFVEKPTSKTARTLIDAGAVWNAGIFAWTAERFLTEIEATPLSEMIAEFEAGEFAAGYSRVEPVSIDRVLLERTARIQVLRLDAGWTDVGTWSGVARAFGHDQGADHGNTQIGTTETSERDTADNIVAAPNKHVSLVGVNGLVVAAYDDRILVASQDKPAQLRALVETLREQDNF